jgi:hypothetical protein
MPTPKPLTAAVLIAVSLVGASGCGSRSQTSQSSPSAARCTAVADPCELPSGPLGVCERAACAPGETPPCFQCTPQH